MTAPYAPSSRHVRDLAADALADVVADHLVGKHGGSKQPLRDALARWRDAKARDEAQQ